jgi:hypothetical protein
MNTPQSISARRAVTISFNVNEGTQVAVALDDAVERFFTNLVLSRPLSCKFIPRPARKILCKLNDTRVRPEISPITRSLVLSSEVVFRLLAHIPQIPLDVRLWLAEVLFDLSVFPRVGRPAVFHFASGVGLRSGRLAKRRGALIVCHRRALHHEVEAQLVRTQLPTSTRYRHPEEALSRRLTKEYQLADVILCNSRLTARSFESKDYPVEQLQGSGHGARILVRSGAGFDLVAQDEVGAGVTGVRGGQVLTQLRDGGGGPLCW